MHDDPLSQTSTRPSDPLRVTVVDFDMSFGQLILFLVKAAIAAVPAVIILAFLSAILLGILGGILGGLTGLL
jgi:hypothetical protein